MTAASCSQCGAAFTCGRDDPRGCWCAQLPSLTASQLEPAAACLCEKCLAARLAQPDRARSTPAR